MRVRRVIAMIMVICFMFTIPGCAGKTVKEAAPEVPQQETNARTAETETTAKTAEQTAETETAAKTEEQTAETETTAKTAEQTTEADAAHVHEYVKHNGLLACMADKGVVEYYHCEGCGTYFDQDYNEIDAFRGNHVEEDQDRVYFVLRDLQVDYDPERTEADKTEFFELCDRCIELLLKEQNDEEEEEYKRVVERLNVLWYEYIDYLTEYRIIYPLYSEYDEYYDTYLTLLDWYNECNVKILDAERVESRVMGEDEDEINEMTEVIEADKRANQIESETKRLEKRFLEGGYESYSDYFNELIPLLNEFAQIYGYSNYEDYSYEVIWERDYSAEDFLKIGPYLKELFVPYSLECYRKMLECNALIWDDPVLTEKAETYFKGTYNNPLVIGVVNKVGGGYLNCYNELLDNGYLFIGPRGSVPSGGRVGYLKDDEYCISIFGTESHHNSVLFAHEFGHYFARKAMVQNIDDFSEVYSYGSELLLAAYVRSLLGEYADDPDMQAILGDYLYSIEDMVIGSIPYSYISAAFFHYLYTHDDYDDDTLTAVYDELAAEYGIDHNSDGMDSILRNEYDFYLSAPSYGLSELFAAKIYFTALQDFDAGCELYFNCFDPDIDSISASERADYIGLGNPFEEDFYQFFAK